MSGSDLSPDRRLADRIALVTGASRGIGYAASLAIAKAGAHVIAVARTTGGLEELDDDIREQGGSATLVPLDLKDGNAIVSLAATIAERWGRLDCLVANAGILGTVTPLSHLKPNVFDEVMAVNLTANFHLIRALETGLLRSDAGRALFVTSGASRSRRPFTAPYAASKAALEAMVISWAREHEKSSFRANLLNPGTIRTRMRAQYAPGEDAQTVTPAEDIAPTFVDLLSADVERTASIYDFRAGGWLDD